MVQLIVGDKGKGKTKILLDKVNTAIKDSTGNIVYLDKTSKHMYELNNKIRLIDVSVFPINNSDEFVGFIYGILSQDHDLEQMYLDNFLKLSNLQDNVDGVEETIKKLDKISKQFNVDFVVSISVDKSVLPESLNDYISVAV